LNVKLPQGLYSKAPKSRIGYETPIVSAWNNLLDFGGRGNPDVQARKTFHAFFMSQPKQQQQ
jgi:hypothetical protein